MVGLLSVELVELLVALVSGMSSAGSQSNGGTRILWVAPNLNAYKQQFLERLASGEEIHLWVFAGAGEAAGGHRYLQESGQLLIHRCQAGKKQFGTSLVPFIALIKQVRAQNTEMLLMPIEKKLLGMILALICLRPFLGYQLVSYNHPCLRSGNRVATNFDLKLTRWLFARYDRIIFYTEKGMEWAVARNLLPKKKAHFANNTLDTEAIKAWANLEPVKATPFKICFIGRLIPNKRVTRLVETHARLRQLIPGIELHVIGDGPEKPALDEALSNNCGMVHHGALVEEKEISKVLNACHAVFVPGSSGLSIVHALAYGKPYITIRGQDFTHGPEFDYLEDGVNSLILEGDSVAADAQRITDFLQDTDRYTSTCAAAYKTAEGLSVTRWTENMTRALHARASGTGSEHG